MTIAFVMVSEILILAPSIARFRMDWLEQKLTDAHLALLALEATPDNMVSQELADRLLANAGAYAIRLINPSQVTSTEVQRVLALKMPPKVQATYSLAGTMMAGSLVDALATLGRGGSRTLLVIGAPRQEPEMPIAVVLDEAPLRQAMRDYAARTLEVSLVISLVTAALVFFSLQWLLVGPMRRIIAAMMAFRSDPEDATRILVPSDRADEVGIAQRELSQLQKTVHEALHERARLAALGTAVSKINHDLRNILSTARLISDRLADDPSPEVRRITPSLVAAIDSAVELCTGTLNFVRDGSTPPRPTRLALSSLIDELAAAPIRGPSGVIEIDDRVSATLLIHADRAQLYRCLLNLAHNAAEAGATRLTIDAMISKAMDGRNVAIDVADDGHGISLRARASLFQAFSASGRPGGSGLGLAITREILHAHGGDIVLVATGAEGTRFRLTLPDPTPAAAPARPVRNPVAAG
ncbi:MAG TPA: HAMP domain-containing sensor histidine kinase [Stellaceae bacterium]|nr:HAMP domain-containing sensor histidine kinase [Stellaceae bacterium]